MQLMSIDVEHHYLVKIESDIGSHTASIHIRMYLMCEGQTSLAYLKNVQVVLLINCLLARRAVNNSERWLICAPFFSLAIAFVMASSHMTPKGLNQGCRGWYLMVGDAIWHVYSEKQHKGIVQLV